MAVVWKPVEVSGAGSLKSQCADVGHLMRTVRVPGQATTVPTEWDVLVKGGTEIASGKVVGESLAKLICISAADAIAWHIHNTLVDDV